MKRVFFHVHIWKTGGTSFLNVCRENFGKGFHRDIMLIQDWFLSTQQLRWLLNYHDWIRCYSCHMLSGELPYDMDDTEVIGVSFVRDPVNRFVSSYSFQRGDTYRGGVAKKHNFDSFYKKVLMETGNPMWRNGQTYILGGERTEFGIDRISKRLANDQLVLLPTERFDESCMVLEKLFPENFKDCSYVTYNVSKKKTPITEQQRTAIAGCMDLDFSLHTLANDYLNSALDRFFPDLDVRRRRLDEFRHRCISKRRRRQASNLINKLGKKVKSGLKTIASSR
jgi:hypothetical protein